MPDEIRIHHIKDEIDFILDIYQNLTYTDFMEDRRLRLAAQKSLEIIGEAANQISPSLQEKYPDIPWRILSGLRNRLTHQYFDVSWSIIWETLRNDIPQLSIQIEALVEKEHY